VTGLGGLDNSICNKILDLLEVGYLRLGEIVIENYSNQVWSGYEVAMVMAVLDGCSEVDECDNSRIWIQTISDQKRLRVYQS